MHKNYSETTAMLIDDEIRRIVEENHVRTREILTEHKDALVEVAEALLERENMDGSEIREMIFGPEETKSEEVSSAKVDSEEMNSEGTASEESVKVDDEAASAEPSAAEE